MGEFNLQNGLKVPYRVVNLVVNAKLPLDEIDLEKVYLELLDKNYDVAYNPEEFPGVVIRYRGEDSKKVASILIFRTGSIVISGISDLDRCKEVIERVLNELMEISK